MKRAAIGKSPPSSALGRRTDEVSGGSGAEVYVD